MQQLIPALLSALPSCDKGAWQWPPRIICMSCPGTAAIAAPSWVSAGEKSTAKAMKIARSLLMLNGGTCARMDQTLQLSPRARVPTAT